MFALPPDIPPFADPDDPIDHWSRLEGKSATMVDELGRWRENEEASHVGRFSPRARLQLGLLAAIVAGVVLAGCVF